MKIACISLGCPKNQVDLDVMVHILLSAGHETVADLGEADVILVNTCGFIESAKTEAIENILEACSYKQANPNLKVIVTGCLAERYRSQIEEEIPEVDAVVGCASNKAIDTIVFVPEVGSLYYGKVVRILKFGAFVELAPGKDGMVHISKLADHRIGRVEDAVNVGDMIWVKVTDIDEKGRVNLSHIDAIREIKAKKLAKQN